MTDQWNVIAACMVTEAIAAADKVKQEFLAGGADEREAGTDYLNVAPMMASAFCRYVADGDRARQIWLMKRTAAALTYLAELRGNE